MASRILIRSAEAALIERALVNFRLVKQVQFPLVLTIGTNQSTEIFSRLDVINPKNVSGIVRSG